MAGVLRHFGLSDTSGSNWESMHRRLKAHGITGYFRRKKSNNEIFIEGSTGVTRTTIRKRLIEDYGWEYKCSTCGIDEWLGKALTLHVDHINGVSNDNRLENLRFLCPNCHQQTPTWGNKGPALGELPFRGPERKDNKPQHKRKTCLDCSRQVSQRAQRCKSCAGKHRSPTKIRWPPLDELVKMVEETNYSVVGRTLGVSDNAVRKRIRMRNRTSVSEPA